MSRFHGRTISACLMAAYVLALTTFAAAAGPNLKYVKRLTPPALEQEELIRAALDSDVYEATRDGFPDLRLLDSRGQEVPFLIRPAFSHREETTRDTWTAHRSPSAKPLESDGLEITLELDRDDPTPGGLRLVSPLHDFEHRVRVEFSPDGNAWQPLVTDGLIFDYARYIDVRHDTVQWALPDGAVEDDKTRPDAPLRRLRITIDNVSQDQESQLVELTRDLRGKNAEAATERLTIERRPFRIERIELFRDRVQPRLTGPRLVEYSLSGLEVANDAESKRTLITVQSRREPLTSLSLVTAAHNFSRAATLETERREGSDNWQQISSGVVSRIDFRDLDSTNLAISMAETRRPRYRVVIANRDSPPLTIDGVTARGPVHEVVLLAEPNGEYRLAYGGGSNVRAPDYDLAALTASLAAGYSPREAKLGEQTVLSQDVVTDEPALRRWLNDPRILAAAIAALVAVLAVVLYQAGRRVNRRAG